MFLGLNWLKFDDLGSKRRNLGFKRSEKGQKDTGKVDVGPHDDQDWRSVVRPTPYRCVRRKGLFYRPLLKLAYFFFGGLILARSVDMER